MSSRSATREFRGLNLTFECREGILKHCSVRNARELGELGERFIKRQQPGLEAQIANLADEIAYNNHDVDDGIRAQLIDLPALREVRMFRRQYDAVAQQYPELGERRVVHETIRRMINYVVIDFIHTTQAQLELAQPRSIDEVRAHPKPLAMLSAAVPRGAPGAEDVPARARLPALQGAAHDLQGPPRAAAAVRRVLRVTSVSCRRNTATRRCVPSTRPASPDVRARSPTTSPA